MSENVLSAKMSLENAGFVQKMRGAAEASEACRDKLKSLALGLSGLGVAFGAFRSIEGIMDGITSQFEKGRQALDIARKTTESVKSLVILQQAFRDTGESAEDVGHTVLMMQHALGGVSETGEPTGEIFKQLNLSIGDLKRMDPVAEMQSIGKAIDGLRDPASQTNAAMKIFGRSGGEMLNLLRDPEAFTRAAQAMGPMADELQKNASAFEKVSKSMELMRLRIQSIFTGIASGLAPAIQTMADSLNKVDFTSWGEKIGNVIFAVTEAFKEGHLGEVIELSLKVALKNSVNYAAGVAAIISDLFHTAMKDVFDTGLFDGIKEGFLGVAAAFLAELAKVKPALMQALRDAYDSTQAWMQNKTLDQYRKDNTEAGVRSYLEKNAINPATNAPLGSQGVDILMDRRAKGLDSHYFDRNALTDGQFGERMVSSVQETFPTDDTVMGKTSQGWSTKAAADLSDAHQKISAAAPKLIEDLTNVAKAFQAYNVLDPTKDKDKLSALFAQFQAARQKFQDDMNQAGSGGGGGVGLGTERHYKAPEADRFARLGMFIGGAPATHGISEAKRTAKATEQAVQLLKQLVKKPANINAGEMHMASAYA